MLLTATTFCGTLLALQLLTSNWLTPHLLMRLHAVALPITSKPIESTAENLAWQAWLMLPPEQKNREKSRKVTPKSIFTLPFRECPPGHQLYETRCIPTVHIDQQALLTQQLLGFVIGDANAQQNYEFDYEDEEVVMYEPPQRLSSHMGADQHNHDGVADGPASSQLPALDEPLKFNIFQQKFPTDYADAESGSLEGSGGAGMAMGMAAVAKQAENRTSGLLSDANFMDAFKGFLERQANMTQAAAHNNNQDNQHNEHNNNYHHIDYGNTQHNNNHHHFGNNDNYNNNHRHPQPDLQSDGSNISANIATAAASSSTISSSSDAHIFSFGEIDAIALPAGGHGAAAPTTSNADLETTPAHQRVSLFKDDSAVQLVTSMISDAETTSRMPQRQQQKQQDLTQLLKVDALLPLFNVTQAAATTHNATIESLHVATPASAPIEAAVTVMPLPADAEQSTTFEELLSAAAEEQKRKAERTRSVTETSMEELKAQEDFFSTTVEPEGTTNIQLDETTIIEAHEPTAFVRQELEAQLPWRETTMRQWPSVRDSHSVLKKSKVEPVEWQHGMRVSQGGLERAEEEAITARVIAASRRPTGAASTAVEGARRAAETATEIPQTTVIAAAVAAASATATKIAATEKSATETTTTTKEEVATTITFESATVEKSAATAAITIKEAAAATPTPAVQADRFSKSQLGVAAANKQQRQTESENVGDIAGGRSTATLDKGVRGESDSGQASEINIEQELRMINALVKGKRQQPAATTTTTTTTESSLTAATADAKITESATAAQTETKTKTSETTTPAIVTTITTTTATINKENVNAETMAKTTAIENVATAIATTTAVAPTTTTEASATIWSKIMPILGWGQIVVEPVATTTTTTITINAEAATTTTTTTITPTVAELPAAKVATTTTDGTIVAATTTTTLAASSNSISPINSISSSSSTGSSNNNNRNRSNRNSKVSKMPPLPFPVPHEATSTPLPATTTAIASAEPFWWLPAGWRLDGQEQKQQQDVEVDSAEPVPPSPPADDADYDAAAQSLLMRFWSAFPGNQAKVKE